MQLRYDLNVGALYISLSDRAVARTREIDGNTAIDLDADDTVVGIEVVSVRHPWSLNEILTSYKLPAGEEAQLHAYFYLPQLPAEPVQEAPKISMASPAPALAAA